MTDILRRDPKNKVVLLDPDTGIEPQQAKPEHVERAEIRQVWEPLADGDWLVMYQHWLRTKGWRDVKRREFEACSAREAEVFESRRIVNDVVFFAVRK